MAGKLDGGGPAFPVAHGIDGNWQKEPLPEFSGMTLRRWYAGLAMQGYLAMCADPEISSRPAAEWTAKRALEYADALIAAEKAGRE